MMYSSSASASLMLFGEHAVLHGMQAICCAADQRIRVSLTPRDDHEIHLHSAALGSLTTTLENLTVIPPFQFVLTAIEYYRAQILSGFDLVIDAEFSATLGLGSSAAVTAATLGTLSQWLGAPLSSLALFQAAKQVVLQVQGIGSGADVAAAIFGGMVAYRMDPLEIKPFAITPDITLVYSGAKVPTKTVIQWVSERQQANPQHYQNLFQAIDTCTQQAIAALQQQDWQTLGALMNEHHLLHEKLGVSTSLLNELTTHLRQQPGILGAKISGSGLGDCIVGLGSVGDNIFPVNDAQKHLGVLQVPVKISAVGYREEC